MKMTRRNAIGLLATTASLERKGAAQQLSSAPSSQPIELNWLGGAAPPLASGISWGVPWPRGAVRKDSQNLGFQLLDVPR
jgi:hypothetical protein